MIFLDGKGRSCNLKVHYWPAGELIQISSAFNQSSLSKVSVLNPGRFKWIQQEGQTLTLCLEDETRFQVNVSK